MADEIVSMNVRIEGDVQGMGFRDFAVREANSRGLRGWVRNRSDGSVEAVASGPQKIVEDFIAVCMRGPAGARVTAVNVQKAGPPDQLGFIRRPSV